MTYKVVQLTDTHLFADPAGTQKGVNTYETLQAVVAEVAARHNDFDALLLTGDLSQDETPESYALLGQMLAPLRHAPIYAIPGNHDDLGRMRAQLAADGLQVLSDALLGKWRIAMLNSQVPGRVHGELGSGQIEQLQASLRDAHEHIMVALHHPPVAVDSAWIDASRCLDGEDLLCAVTDAPVRAVLCGHVHQRFETTRQGVAILTTPSTCVQFTPQVEEFDIDYGAAPGYRVFELYDDGSWWSAVHRVAVA